MVLRPMTTASIFSNDLPALGADHWASLLLPHFFIPFPTPMVSACCGLGVSITYLLYTEDRAVGILERMVLLEMKMGE